ncbi:MAG TPA: response regulator transcription factor [Rubricoccaceae bacterium]
MPYQIFVVEDHPVMREAYVSLLESTPGLALCGTAATAEEVLDKLDDLECDLIVTDYRLPGLSGAELVRQVRAGRPELPVVVISAHDDEAFVASAQAAGAAAVMGKRDLADTFAPTILAVLDEHLRHAA